MNDIHDLVAPYALDALDPDELLQFEAHLDTCEQCRDELIELREGAADIAESVAVAPPPSVKGAVMKAIEEPVAPVIELQPKRSAAWLGATAVAAAIALVFAGLWAVSNNQLEQADLVAAVYEAPDATSIEIETSAGPARFTYSPSLQRGVFNGGQLGEVGEEELYQLWLIGDEGPVSAGTLEAGESDVVVESVEPGLVLAMTIETVPGVNAPTTDPLFAADL
jgi:hypothetical protein